MPIGESGWERGDPAARGILNWLYREQKRTMKREVSFVERAPHSLRQRFSGVDNLAYFEIDSMTGQMAHGTSDEAGFFHEDVQYNCESILSALNDYLTVHEWTFQENGMLWIVVSTGNK